MKAIKGGFDAALELIDTSAELGFAPAIGFRCTFLAYGGDIEGGKQCWLNLTPVFKERFEPLITDEEQWEVLTVAYFDRDQRLRGELLERVDQHFANPNPRTNQYIMGMNLALGSPERYMEQFVSHRSPFGTNRLSSIWLPSEEYTAQRQRPGFPDFAERIGLVRAWQGHGWPHNIRALQGTDGSDLQCSVE